MPLSFTEWSPDDRPGEVHSIESEADLVDLARRYSADGNNRALNRILDIARQHGVKSVVIENRYIDSDWRSQHAEFYGSTFTRYPSVCHRLHFFTAVIPSNLQDLGQFQDNYRGYSVMRPLPNAPVGRTMICPPPQMDGAVTAQATETIHLFGWAFTITAMPFISQDSQYLRCAHASLWMVLRHAEFVHGLPRQLPKQIHEACSGGVVEGRQIPSAGLTQHQLLDGSTRLGLSMARMPVPARNDTPDITDVTLYNVTCRYISSQLPPIVLSPNHAWVVVAWQRVPSRGNSRITLWRHDDSAGPYLRVDDPYDRPDDGHVWTSILMPLMNKMYIAAERAELAGYAWLNSLIDTYGSATSTAVEARDAGGLTVQTYAVRSTDFKARIAHRDLPSDLAALYRLSHMPRYIWVVEAVDRRAREAGEPDVLGEVLIDSTQSEGLRPESTEPILAAHVGSMVLTNGTDHRSTRTHEFEGDSKYRSDLYTQLSATTKDKP